LQRYVSLFKVKSDTGKKWTEFLWLIQKKIGITGKGRRTRSIAAAKQRASVQLGRQRSLALLSQRGYL
jgi:hypothetical protein